MKILILGSEGFIGNHLIEYFSIQGYNVYGCDLFEKPAKSYNYFRVGKAAFGREILNEKTFDVCINAGGNGNVPASITEPLLDFESNGVATIRTLESIRLYSPECKYIHISSAAVYGNPSRIPVVESDLLSPISPYGWHKLVAEKLCIEYNSIFNIRTAFVRPFSVYGPGLRKQIFWDLYQKSFSDSKTVELWGTGKESRDFIFIEDLMQIFKLIIEKGNFTGEVYNAGTGTETTISEVAGIFYQNLGKPKEIVFNGKVREGDPINWMADIGKINALGFNPTVSISTGIKKLTEWMKGLN